MSTARLSTALLTKAHDGDYLLGRLRSRLQPAVDEDGSEVVALQNAFLINPRHPIHAQSGDLGFAVT